MRGGVISALAAAALGAPVWAAAGPACAHDYRIGQIDIEHPSVSPTPGGQTASAGYLTFANRGPADRLIAASSPAAERVEIHATSLGADGAVQMRPQPNGVPLPAQGVVRFESGGFHLMFIGLRSPLREGDLVPLTLRFERAGSVNVQAIVERPGAPLPHNPHH